jgi:hypothetical protein
MAFVFFVSTLPGINAYVNKPTPPSQALFIGGYGIPPRQALRFSHLSKETQDSPLLFGVFFS